MNEDLVARLRAVRVRTPEEVMADYRCGQQLGVDDLINNGQEFYDDSLPIALRAAKAHAGSEGVVASLPYLVAGKAKTDRQTHSLWKRWFSALSEEYVGIDTAGKHGAPGGEIVVTVHGGGLLTADRIDAVYKKGFLSNGAAKLTGEEWNNLLVGQLSDGSSLDIYTVDDIKHGRIPEPFGRYGVVLDLECARSDDSGYLSKDRFMVNPLVHARIGTLEYLEEYFEKAKHSNDLDVANYHVLNGIDATQPRGRVLYLYINNGGLNGGINLNDNGRFVGVARGDANE